MYKFLTQLGLTGDSDFRGGSQGIQTIAGDGGSAGEGLSGDSLTDVITTAISVVLYAVGIISVVMLVFGGIKYATSAGDEKKVTSAKNTIIYAIIGLAVAILAWTLVNFVFKNLTGK